MYRSTVVLGTIVLFGPRPSVEAQETQAQRRDEIYREVRE